MTEHHPAGFSRLGLLYNCAAPLREVEKAPRKPTNNDAAMGTLCHACVKARSTAPLDDFQKKAVERVWDYRLKKTEEIGLKVVEETYEETLPIHQNGEVCTFGTLDYKALFAGGGLVIDWKFYPSGNIPEWTIWQLRAQAVAVLQKHKDINAVIPIAYEGHSDTEYEIAPVRRDDVPGLVTDIAKIVRAAMDEKFPQHNPGPWCEYCPASHSCQAGLDAVMKTALTIRRDGTPFIRQVRGTYEIVDDEKNAKVFMELRQAKSVIEDALEFVKTANLAAMANGWESKYLTTRHTGKIAKIIDYERAWDTAPEEATSHLRGMLLRKWGVKDLAKAIKKANPSISDAKARQQAEESLAGNIEWKTKAPSVQKRKGVQI